jgi:hypothetical protein
MRSQSRRWLAGTALAAAAALAAAPEREAPLAKPAIPEADRVRLAEAFRLAEELAERTLPEARRTVVCAFGAGQALLLDRERPCWREQYFSKMFSLEPYFATEDCGRAAAGRG